MFVLEGSPGVRSVFLQVLAPSAAPSDSTAAFYPLQLGWDMWGRVV